MQLVSLYNGILELELVCSPEDAVHWLGNSQGLARHFYRFQMDRVRIVSRCTVRDAWALYRALQETHSPLFLQLANVLRHVQAIQMQFEDGVPRDE